MRPRPMYTATSRSASTAAATAMATPTSWAVVPSRATSPPSAARMAGPGVAPSSPVTSALSSWINAPQIARLAFAMTAARATRGTRIFAL